MKIIKIKQKKQDNGIWGIPYNCYYIDYIPVHDERKMIIFSAIIAAFNDYHNRKFKINFSGSSSFTIRTGDTDNSFGEYYKLYYENYEVIDDTLYEFANKQEHIIFLRKHKLNKLQNVF